jgi:hypothetical protein
MIGLQINGGSRAAPWLLYIVILKKEVPKSSLFSLRRARIFIQLVRGPMTFSKQD